MLLHKLRIEAADLQAAQRAADRLADPSAPEALAITLFELAPPAFVVEAYYDCPPSLEAIARFLTGQGAELGPPSLEEVADANWVALSQAALPPVAAGRFVVHGSHDRARFAMRRLAIEIEAGEAFGTAHNATTVLCLQALDRLTRKRRFAHVLDLGCGTRRARHRGGTSAAGGARGCQRQRPGRDRDCARERAAEPGIAAYHVCDSGRLRT